MKTFSSCVFLNFLANSTLFSGKACVNVNYKDNDIISHHPGLLRKVSYDVIHHPHHYFYHGTLSISRLTKLTLYCALKNRDIVLQVLSITFIDNSHAFTL